MHGKVLCLSIGLIAALACVPSTQQPGDGASSAPGQPRYGGILSVHGVVDPFNWDPIEQKGTPHDELMALHHESLLGFKKGPDLDYMQWELTPELADRWEVSNESRTFSFRLREGARFQNLPPVNGREVTSADVKFSVSYRLREGDLKEKKLPVAQISYIFEGLERVEAVDQRTAVFHFKEPYIPFLSYAASDWNPVLPREVYDQDGHFRDNPVGAGPYMLDAASSQQGTRWMFKKNPDYWDPTRPYLDGIRWLVLPAESALYAAFQTKQVDLLADGREFNDAQELMKANPQAHYNKHYQPNSSDVLLSQLAERNSPVRDIRIRRALSLAIDRDEMNRVQFGGQGEWGVPVALMGLFTPAEIRQMLRFDLEEARRLVREAGHPNGVTLDLPISNNMERSSLATVELLQAMWKRAGLNAEIKAFERVDAQQKLRRGDWDVNPRLGQGAALHDDPDSLAFGRFHGKSPNNYGRVNDPEVDRLLEAQRREADPEKRREILRAVSKRLVDQMWAVQLLHRPKYSFWHPYVKNYRPNFGSKADYTMVWLEK